MATTDMDTIKEVPGYKIILKVILKQQIKQLIEQLATTTEEESIIITASVADGTLSHLGSDSARGFLEDHEDVKSQFLGYCLKTHHQRKQEDKERREAEEEAARMLQAPPLLYPAPSPRGSPRGGFRGRAPRFSGVRHEPYPVSQPRRFSAGSEGQGIRNTSMSLDQSGNMKTEPFDQNSSETDNVSSPSTQSHSDQEQLNIGSNPSGLGGAAISGNDNVDVKQEEAQESEEELEITGVEPGQIVPGDVTWDPNLSLGASFDLMGATGSQGDMANQQKYKSMKSCQYCGRRFMGKSALDEHIRTHTGEKPFKCDQCGKSFALKGNMKKHKITHLNMTKMDFGKI